MSDRALSPLILASRSAIRVQLLRQAGVALESMGSNVDEAGIKHDLVGAGRTPGEIAQALAEAKALAVSADRSGLVIGADQTLELDDAMMDKPADLSEARRQLVALRGRVHRLHSALAAAEGAAVVWREVRTATLTVRPFSDDFLDRYLAREGEALLDCVGCYRLEGEGVQLFERIEGDYFTVLGLPLLGLLAFLRQRGALAS